MDKRFAIILGVVAAVLVGFLLFRGGDEAKAPSGNGDQNNNTNQSSEVELIEYADYQCPFCANFHPIVKQVVEKYKDQISFEMRHLPLVTHENARAAARAAEAARNQDKFTEMSDLLFQNQQAWSESGNARAIFEQYAGQLGLDVAQFEEDFISSEVNDRINADVAEYNKTGHAMSTPAFFLNGERLTLESVSIEALTKPIDEALKQAGQSQ